MDKSLIVTLVSVAVAGSLLALAIGYSGGVGIVCTTTIIIGTVVKFTSGNGGEE